MRKPIVLSLCFLLLVSLASIPAAYAQGAAAPRVAFSLSLIHVNDTHSEFEPSLTRLSIDIDEGLKAKPVYLELGGYPYLAQAIAELRSTEANPLVVHAGDFFQGTLYYTKYQGEADLAFWNLVRLDVATLGNHEFDKGSLALRDVLLSKAKFPIVDADVDMRKDPVLKDFAPAPFKILEVGGQRIGLIGETTTETPFISSPDKSIVFLDPVAAAQKAADALAKAGVDKIVLVSHLGYDEDLKLAAGTRGIDVIVGGHSHTLLGAEYKADGLSPMGEYPTVVKDASGGTTLVVQAWEWAKVLGELVVDFDAKGRVVGYKDKSALVAASDFVQANELPDPEGKAARARWQWSGYGLSTFLYDGKDWVPAPADSLAYWSGMYGKLRRAIAARPEIKLLAGDPAAWTLVRGYALGVQELQRSVVAQVGEDLKRGLNAGPGPIVADAMRAYTGAQIGMTNVGGVRIDLLAGPLTTAKVYEVIPFGNTLVTFKAAGAEVLRILEDGIDFGLAKYGDFPANPLLYVSGLKLSISPAKPKGSRLSEVKVQESDGSWSELDPSSSYTMVVNSFMAAGGDRYESIKSIPSKTDTGYIDAEAFFAFAKGKTLVNDEERIELLQ